jgi:hypothetical protein
VHDCERIIGIITNQWEKFDGFSELISQLVDYFSPHREMAEEVHNVRLSASWPSLHD